MIEFQFFFLSFMLNLAGPVCSASYQTLTCLMLIIQISFIQILIIQKHQFTNCPIAQKLRNRACINCPKLSSSNNLAGNFLFLGTYYQFFLCYHCWKNRKSQKKCFENQDPVLAIYASNFRLISTQNIANNQRVLQTLFYQHVKVKITSY